MVSYVRYAIYYVPPAGDLADFGAAWLGWDIARGEAAPQPAVPGVDLAGITAEPRKYGFHATLKPPFRLADGRDAAALADAARRLAATQAPVRLEGLRLSRLGGFLALTPEGDTGALDRLAARTVAELDPFRAPAGPDELARRGKADLTPAQEVHLARWGYPFVMEEFRFHMTLTCRLADPAPVEAALAARLPDPPRPFVIDQIALVGERADGMFQLIHRYALTASSA